MAIWRDFQFRLPGFRRLYLLTVVLLLVGACAQQDEYQVISGDTMGTYYTVTCHCPDTGQLTALTMAISSELEQVNAQMSTYDPQSTLSRFNAAAVGEWVDVDAELITVLNSALTLSVESNGAFDVTVGPLVNAWGFGPTSVDSGQELSAIELAALLERVGYQLLEIRSTPPALRKTADIYVDLSAIAKGHGVDRVTQVLQQNGCTDFLVDIGGEVRVQGVNPAGRAWRIGIEVPDPESQGGVQRILALHNQAVATSGDYRNFREIAGHRFSHTIDPRTGRPVDHGLASVTVVHESAMWADGYATAINVLGPQAGFALAEAHGLSALLITRSPDGYQELYTSGMSNLLVQP